MNDIANKSMTLKLNSNWVAIDIMPVSKAICDLINGVVMAVDIVYDENEDGTPNFDEHKYVNPVSWDEWVKLPVRSWDWSLRSAHLHIRVPTVVITSRYSKINKKQFKKKPTIEGLRIRDKGIDGYTGKPIEDMSRATIDHVVARSNKGPDTYENTVLTTKETNNKKGNKSVKEAGLKLFVKLHKPEPVPFHKTIRKVCHKDWETFLAKDK